jgi:hypothetical protein
MQSMSAKQRKDYVNQKAVERRKIQDEIQQLNKSRQAYIALHQQASEDTMLDGAMIKAIREKARLKDLVWK